MFRCQICNKVSAPHEKMAHVVIEQKEMQHRDPFISRNPHTGERVTTWKETGKGRQIVKEIAICKACKEGTHSEEA